MRGLGVGVRGVRSVSVMKEENVPAEVSVLVRTVVAVEEGGLATQQGGEEYKPHSHRWNGNLSDIKRFLSRTGLRLTFNYILLRHFLLSLDILLINIFHF